MSRELPANPTCWLEDGGSPLLSEDRLIERFRIAVLTVRLKLAEMLFDFLW